MTLFDGLFYSGPMLAVFSDENRLQRMLDFESALAASESAAALIPEEASRVIRAACRASIVDIPELLAEASRTGNLAIPLVKQLTQAVAAENPTAARYVHWGATSQDVMDTGLVLQMREALILIEQQVEALVGTLAELADCHASTCMPGRTWLQHAVPITFGWKVAGWLDAMLRHGDRLADARQRVLTLQFGGAAGTLASLGQDGEAVANGLAERLGLTSPAISWHSSRDRLVEVATVLGLLVGTLGKVARDISLLMQSEVAELFEAAGEGRGGSSTMPQKRNPVQCATMLAASERVPGLVATMLLSMSQEHERGIGNWQAEWETLPQIFNLCSGSLDRAIDVIAGLEVDARRMSANLELTHGLIYAERVSMALARSMGREPAHALVEKACKQAIAGQRRLCDVLSDDAECRKHMSEAEIHAQFDASSYLGVARESVSRVVERARLSAAATRTLTVEALGMNTHVAMSGPANKPVLVLSHSLGTDLSMWDSQIDAFAKHFRVLRYDTRGHGGPAFQPARTPSSRWGETCLRSSTSWGLRVASSAASRWVALSANGWRRTLPRALGRSSSPIPVQRLARWRDGIFALPRFRVAEWNPLSPAYLSAGLRRNSTQLTQMRCRRLAIPC